MTDAAKPSLPPSGAVEFRGVGWRARVPVVLVTAVVTAGATLGTAALTRPPAEQVNLQLASSVQKCSEKVDALAADHMQAQAERRAFEKDTEKNINLLIIRVDALNRR